MERMKFKYTAILICAYLGLLFSCVNDGEPEPCPPEIPETESVYLHVDFAEALYSTRSESLKKEVETMYVFVFGHDGYYITTLKDDTPDVGSDYIIPVPLSPGDYEFIGWSNLHGSFNLPDLDLVAGKTTVEDLFVELDIAEGDTVYEIGNHLHYGLVREPRRVIDNVWEYHMALDRYTYTINILTEGLEPDGDDYLYVIADRNGRFSFYSDEISERTIYYVADCDKDADGQLQSSLTVLRLLEDHLDSTVRIENKNTGEVLFDDFLIRKLLSLRDHGEVVDFSAKHEYTIKLIFSSNVLVAVTIDGWVVFRLDDYEI